MTQTKDNNYFANLQNDYASWLSQVLVSSFYEELSSRKNILPPHSVGEGGAEDLHVPSRILESQAVLHEMAKTFLDAEGKPPKESFETFLITYENFQTSLQRLEQDSLLADFGIDSLTGLRSKGVMVADLERELERRSRRGQPFCFVLSRIDGVEARKDEKNMVLAAKCIEKTIRSFDDAYVSAEGEILSCLKHSDDNGGLKFITRLNFILSKDENVKFTMSSFVAEPLPGDNITQLISLVRQSLDDLARKTNAAAGQYEDISPLSRYIQSLDETPTE